MSSIAATDSFVCTQLNDSKYYNVISINQFLHTVKFFQVSQFNTNYSVQHYSFVCPIKWFQVFLWNTNNSICQSFVCRQLNDPTVLSGTTTPGKSGPGSNVNEEILHIPQSSRTWASPSDAD